MARSRNSVDIGKVVRDAAVFNFRNSREEVVDAEPVIQDVDRLFAVLTERGIDYLLVGGIAMLLYVDGRNTEDVDLIFAIPDLERLPELEIESRDANFARAMFGALKVDLLLTSNKFFDAVQRRRATAGLFMEREIPCATVEGLILLKLYALPSLYRQGNFARIGLYENDVATLIQAYNPGLEELLSELEDHLSTTDLAAVKDILNDIQRRIDRFQTGNAND